MSKSILEVRGIGPATVAVLAENGIQTAADLASKKISQVAEIKGFSEIRAAQVITAAKELIAEEQEPVVEKITKEAKKKKPKKTEKKALKKKSEDKKPKNAKKSKPESKKNKTAKKEKKEKKSTKKKK
jgi:transcription termination factor NusA